MSTGAHKPTLVIRLVQEDRASVVLRFHEEHVGPHLWPRSLPQILELAEAEALLEAVQIDAEGGEQIIGVCYVKEENEPTTGVPRWEFGGVFVREDFRGTGIAKALGVLCIANLFVWDPLPAGSRLIAHVHEKNDKPRRLLQEQLGFTHVGEEIPPAEVVPPNLERNDKGEVVGHLFEFNVARLSEFANWLEEFDGQLVGKKGAIPCHIQMSLHSEHLDVALQALRDLARSADDSTSN